MDLTAPGCADPLADIKQLGLALVEVADLYPLIYRTERDFFPLVLAYLHGRVPTVKTEVGMKEGSIDFRVGGKNPAVLELAVAPRALVDPHYEGLKFPGHKVSTQLYATQNKTEIKKLRAVPQSRAKNRYLLLLDLRGTQDSGALKEGYEAQLAPGGGGAVIRVVYVKRNASPMHFRIGGKQKAKKKP